MIITTTYTAESKKEVKALRMMHLNLQDAGLEVVLVESTPGEDNLRVMVTESRRARRSKQQIAEDALAAGKSQL